MYLAYIDACTLVIYQGTFCILPFNCVCNRTLALIALGIKNKKIAIFFPFFRRSVEGRGAGIRPATAVPPLPVPSWRSRVTYRETIKSSAFKMHKSWNCILSSHERKALDMISWKVISNRQYNFGCISRRIIIFPNCGLLKLAQTAYNALG